MNYISGTPRHERTPISEADVALSRALEFYKEFAGPVFGKEDLDVEDVFKKLVQSKFNGNPDGDAELEQMQSTETVSIPGIFSMILSYAVQAAKADNRDLAWSYAVSANYWVAALLSFDYGKHVDTIAASLHGKVAVSSRIDQKLKPLWEDHCKKAKSRGVAITKLDDLFQFDECDTEFKKNIDSRTLKRWAKEAGIIFKAGRPKK